MRLCLIMICVFNFAVNAGVYSQNTGFDINMKNAELKQIIEEIQKQSDLGFLYNIDEIKRVPRQDVCVKNASVQEILDIVLKNTNYTYLIQKDVILIKKSEKKNPDKKVVKGKITDEKGNPLPGVTVIVKGTNTGVSTDIKGEFSINVPNDKNILSFSFVGMQAKDVKISHKTFVTVVMIARAQEMDEVVITGYQNIEKRKLTSSVISVKGDAIREGGAVSLDNMLQGKIAGLSVMNPTSTVGAAPKVRIRGASSISGNREPVWVVDGIILEDPVPISATELNSPDKVNLIGNAISSLNPEDIERIDILKDASATAIYGVKAANGVIVITTKKGEEGKIKVRYSNNLTISQRPQYSDLQRMNSKERIEVSKEIEERKLPYIFQPGQVAYEGALFDFYSKRISYNEFLNRVKEMEEQNTDWFDILFRTSFSQTHNISLSGGSAKTTYYFSVGVSDNKGSFKNNDLSRYNALLKVNSEITDRLRANIQLRCSNSEKTYQHSNIDPYQYAYNTSRAIPCYNNDGTLAYYNKAVGYKTQLKYNILNELENSEHTIGNQNMIFNVNLNYKINSNFNAQALFSYSRSNCDEKEWFNEKTFTAANLRSLNYGDSFPSRDNETTFYEKKCKLPYGGMLENNNTKNTAVTSRLSLNYKQHFGRNTFTASMGTEARSSDYEGIGTKEYGYLPERGDKFIAINPVEWEAYRIYTKDNSNIVTNRQTNIVSLYGTFAYDFDNKFIFNFNVRGDASNKFGQNKDNRFLPIWSVSGRWNLHRSNFIRSISWINSLSLRASYGIQGNFSQDQSPFLIVKLGSTDPTSNEYISTLDKLPNPDLKWEKTNSYNFALDFNILNGRINGNLDVYKKTGHDMIISKQVSQTTGSSSMQLNAGNLVNEGIDMNFNFTPIRNKNFTWNMSVNGGKNKNTVTKSGIVSEFTYKDYLNGNVITPGKSVNTFYAYKFNGLDNNGYPTFKDIEEKEGMTEQEMFNAAFEEAGNRVADITGGFSSSFRYKSWAVNFLFSYSLGSKIRLNPLYGTFGQNLPKPQMNMDDIFVNRWKKPGDQNHTDIPVLSNEKLDLYGLGSTHKYTIGDNKWQMYDDSNKRIASGDFVRLRNMSVRYTVPKTLCKKINISNAHIRLEASNLFIIKDKKLRGQDPEQVSFLFSTGVTPVLPAYTIGFDLTF